MTNELKPADTPTVDVEYERQCAAFDAVPGKDRTWNMWHAWVRRAYDLARTLERELRTAQAERDEIQRKYIALANQGFQNCADANAKISRLEAERDAALAQLKKWEGREPFCWWRTCALGDTGDYYTAYSDDGEKPTIGSDWQPLYTAPDAEEGK